VKDKIPLIVLFIISPQDYIAHNRSARRVDFTLRNLATIKANLATLHIPLHTVTHTPRRTLPNFVVSLLCTFNATRLYANIEYEVDELRRDIRICELAKLHGVKPVFYHDKCIIEPGLVKTQEGKTYTVGHILYFHLSYLILPTGILAISKELDCHSERKNCRIYWLSPSSKAKPSYRTRVYILWPFVRYTSSRHGGRFRT
jgi:hypothetical protein